MSVTIYKNANIDNQGLTSFAVENGKFIKFGKDVEQEYQDAKVVDLPEPVGPVTNTKPRGSLVSS